MSSYNANAEKRINDLVEKALGGDDDIFLSNQYLVDAIDILNTEFNSYIYDSSQDSIRRIKSKLRIQDNILDAYRQMVMNFPAKEDFLDIENELKNI